MTRVLVVGSANLDHTVLVERLPGPGETVLGHTYATAAGGKGLNQAVAAARSGAAVTFVGCVGEDGPGDELAALLATEGIDIHHLSRRQAVPTGMAQIAVDGSGTNTIIVAPLANATLSVADVDAAADAGAFEGAAVVLAQLETPQATVTRAFEHGRRVGARNILNPAPAAAVTAALARLVDLLVPNETEAALLGRLPLGPRAEVIVTLGREGARWGDVHVPAFRVDAVDPTAAGDAFCGALAAALAAGRAMPEALRRASAAGALAATRPGAAPSLPHAIEIDALVDASS